MKSTGGGWHRLKTNPVTLVLQYSPETAMFFFKYKTGARGDSFGYPKVCCFGHFFVGRNLPICPIVCGPC